MGYFSWRSATTDKSIPVGFEDLVAIFPDNTIKRGYYDGYGRIISNNDDPDCDESVDIFTLYGQFIKKGMTRDDCFVGKNYLKINKMIKLVEGWYYDFSQPKYENLPTSQRCEYQGKYYDSDSEYIIATGNPIFIDMFQEEVISLLEGKNVELQEYPGIILLGKGSVISENKISLIKEILKLTDNEFNKMEDILHRYNNEEYWTPELPKN